ncbi:hypothetical protein WAF17_06915 [Bernardetia sp. ABR2-2B]|uniref:hypothetical protein n=1 Tax=Bernardetia sp. ABR2-2B TaxID=3127472 RepID=UPI0030D303C7
MKIDSIFGVIRGSLYSVKYENEDKDEFVRVFNEWSDVEFLGIFFDTHINDLQSGFYGNITPDEAIDITVDKSHELEDELLYTAEIGKTDDYDTLQILFKPLDNKEYRITEHQQTKAYGLEHKSWLRIYAIRISKNCFVVSGGAIKLTETMNEREHLRKELRKLEITKQYLIDNGLFDADNLENFITEQS